jgi:hypothetical protein
MKMSSNSKPRGSCTGNRGLSSIDIGVVTNNVKAEEISSDGIAGRGSKGGEIIGSSPNEEDMVGNSSSSAGARDDCKGEVDARKVGDEGNDSTGEGNPDVSVVGDDDPASDESKVSIVNVGAVE